MVAAQRAVAQVPELRGPALAASELEPPVRLLVVMRLQKQVLTARLIQAASIRRRQPEILAAPCPLVPREESPVRRPVLAALQQPGRSAPQAAYPELLSAQGDLRPTLLMDRRVDPLGLSADFLEEAMVQRDQSAELRAVFLVVPREVFPAARLAP